MARQDNGRAQPRASATAVLAPANADAMEAGAAEPGVMPGMPAVAADAAGIGSGSVASAPLFLGLTRFRPGLVGLLWQLLAVPGLILSGLSPWIVLLPISAFRTRLLFLLAVGHGVGSCIAWYSQLSTRRVQAW